MIGSEKNKYALKTVYDELIEEGYIDKGVFLAYMNLVFVSRSNALRRTSDISMAFKKRKLLDTHAVTRRDHQEQASQIAYIMASRLGLNEIVASCGMMIHDIGHYFYGHEGEDVLDTIGEIENSGFSHHTSNGVDTAETEGIRDKIVEAAIIACKDKEKRSYIKHSPKIMERLQQDSWAFLEPVVGHDGEATKEDSGYNGDESGLLRFNSMEETVKYFTRQANSYNNYKAKVTTLESVLAKPVDVIAYLKSDIENSFRNDVVNHLSDNYLEQTGALLFEDDDKVYSSEERIKLAKDYLRELKVKKLLENPIDENDVNKINLANKALEIEKIAVKKMNELDIPLEVLVEAIRKKNINGKHDKNNKIRIRSFIKNIKMRKKINTLYKTIDSEIEKYAIERGNDEIDKSKIKSETALLNHFTNKLLVTRNVVVEEIGEKIQEALIDDYCENTRKKFEEVEAKAKEEEERTGKKPSEEWMKIQMMRAMSFSDKVQEVIYGDNGLKKLNYEEYVQNAKKEFQTKSVPSAAYKAIKDSSDALIKTGIINNKFNDSFIINNYVKDTHVRQTIELNLMRRNYMDSNSKKSQDELEAEYRDKIGINEFKPIKGYKVFADKIRYFEKSKNIRTLGTIAMSRNSLFRNMYEHVQRREKTFGTVCEDVYYAIPNTIRTMVDKALDKDYKPGQSLAKEEYKRVMEIKKDLKKLFKENNGELSEEVIQKYIDDKTFYERTVNFDKNVANWFAIKYIGGFTDQGIEILLLNTGYLSRAKLNMQNKKTKEASETVAKLLKKYNTNNEEEEVEDKRKQRKPIIIPAMPPIFHHRRAALLRKARDPERMRKDIEILKEHLEKSARKAQEREEKEKAKQEFRDNLEEKYKNIMKPNPEDKNKLSEFEGRE